jgi:hypothetical protein
VKIVQQYPRTDAAASATVALVELVDNDRLKLKRDFEALKREQSRQIAAMGLTQKSIDELKNAPPKTIVIQQPAPPAPKPAPKKVPPPKKRRR